MDTIRVVIADSDPAFRVRIRGVVETSREQLEVAGEASSSTEALTLIESEMPNISLVGVDLSGIGGLELTRQIRLAQPASPVVLLAAVEHQEDLYQAVRHGAAAYLRKDVSRGELLDTIVRVCAGTYVIDDYVLANPALASRVLNAFRDLATMDQQVKPLFAPLTAREIEVLEHAAQGLANKNIARALGISDQTVKNYLTSIMRKLAVNDRTHAVVYALQHGWIKVPEL